jgi:hypothetical protein
VQAFAFQYYKADTVLYRIVDHLWARFVWDIDEAGDWPTKLRECCEAYFGRDAGALVADYVMAWEDLGERFPGHLLPSVDKCLLDLVDVDAFGRLDALAARVRTLPAGPIQTSRIARFLWQHGLFTALWRAVNHRAQARASQAKGDTADTQHHWRHALAHARRAMEFWPENPGMIRHARQIAAQSHEALGQAGAEVAVQADDRLAAKMISTVSGQPA